MGSALHHSRLSSYQETKKRFKDLQGLDSISIHEKIAQ
jgi:hypothetical protein